MDERFAIFTIENGKKTVEIFEGPKARDTTFQRLESILIGEGYDVDRDSDPKWFEDFLADCWAIGFWSKGTHEVHITSDVKSYDCPAS